MNENWCTLAIAILYKTPCTVEQAEGLFNRGNFFRNKRPKGDIEDMLRLKEQGFRIKDIADIFCLDPSTVCNLIRTNKLPARS
ncbi:helix-turn-helix domain-containing protein [Clostridium botulinum]|uniref:helix-turn-helix domain-containing protein n=1 Tax=Clostridium botulinum TaxID=1491 RepID=UPI001A9246D7|nr:helix-turn-helix domain-containing protein [Clostridium botulinum]MBO0538533.1 helix-turn-helix domain-containing protein [Clostridium botulinum]MBO0580351.1 helix-turn-helix domain-containing protein [Clostridium botulinum]